MSIRTVKDNSCKIAQYECLDGVWTHSKKTEKKYKDLFSESRKWTENLQLRLRAADSALKNAREIGFNKKAIVKSLLF
jgi:hypothetical protein